MAMTGAGLAAAIKASFISQKGAPADMAALDSASLALGNAIVTYIQANAVVNSGASVSVPGLGLLDSISGPVSGTATGTVASTTTIS